MRRRSSCGGAFRDGAAGIPVIGKVIRGKDVRRLLYYLFGPGRANEHIDPSLVAGFGDPAELEPERRPDGTRDVRRLAGLLEQPVAALKGPGFDKPVWHCAVRAAPDDRELSDQEWAQVAASTMGRTGLAPAEDDLGVRWVAVRHAADHVHIVATLARQDGNRPRIWNDFYRVREACLEAERRFGLAITAPADRTAARRPARAETEQAVRRGWAEAPRTRLRREVCTAAAGARSEQEFVSRLGDAGVLVRLRYSTLNPDRVTGYAVGLADHTANDGATIWYGGGKLAADLTLPKLRVRWATDDAADRPAVGSGLPAAAARGVLRTMLTRAAAQATDEAGFFARLAEDGVLVKLRFSQLHPGQVTGYSVGLPGQVGDGGEPVWYGGGRLAERLSLPRLRRQWNPGPQRSGPGNQRGRPGLTGPERIEIFEHAARQAGAAAEHIRWCVLRDPVQAADAAHAAADTLHAAARITGNDTLRRAADAYDRAARKAYGREPRRSRPGCGLRHAAWLLSLAGRSMHANDPRLAGLVAGLADLTAAVAELRQAQHHAAQEAAARTAAARLHDEHERMRSASATLCPAQAGRLARPATLAATGTRIGEPSMTRFGGPARDTPPAAGARRRVTTERPSRPSPKRRQA